MCTVEILRARNNREARHFKREIAFINMYTYVSTTNTTHFVHIYYVSPIIPREAAAVAIVLPRGIRNCRAEALTNAAGKSVIINGARINKRRSE